jgi:chorismate mutase
MEKRKVGRPRKTSKNAVILDVKKEKIVNNWKAMYEQLLSEQQLREETAEMFMADARAIISQQADNQLDLVKLVLDSYATMEQHCTEVMKLTGNIEESDILYLTSVARRALLHKFIQFDEKVTV